MKPPKRSREKGRVDGAQGHGVLRLPVGRRIPFGCWHAFSSGVAFVPHEAGGIQGVAGGGGAEAALWIKWTQP